MAHLDFKQNCSTGLLSYKAFQGKGPQSLHFLNLSIRLANPFWSTCSYNQVPDCNNRDQVSKTLLNFLLNADRPVNLVIFFKFLVHPEVVEVASVMFLSPPPPSINNNCSLSQIDLPFPKLNLSEYAAFITFRLRR